MGSKTKTTTTENKTQTAAPPTWTLPGFELLGKMVTDQATANAPGAPYGGNFVAVPDAGAVADQAAAYRSAAEKAGQMGLFSEQQMMSMFQPRDMKAELNAAIEAAIAPTYRNLQENVLPGITNSALQSGAYTNDRALGVVPETAIRDANRGAQEIAAQLGYAGLQAEEDRRLQRAGMLPDLTNLVMQMYGSQGDILGAASGVETAANQAAINNALSRHQYEVAAPYERIAPAAELLALLSGNYGTQTSNGTQTTVQKTGGLGPILQGAMGIASMAAGLGAFGPLGAAAGAAGGAAPGISVNPNLGISSIFGPRR